MCISFLSCLRGGDVLHGSARVPAAPGRTFKAFAAGFTAPGTHALYKHTAFVSFHALASSPKGEEALKKT